MDRPTSIRLAAFGLDGTLLRGETVAEALARYIGRFDRMRELQHPPDLQAIKEMASWYSTHQVEELCACLTQMHFAPGAVHAFGLLKERGIRTAIVSMTWEFAVAWFAEKLGADSWLGTRLLPDGHLEPVWPDDKARWLRRTMQAAGLRPHEVAAIGDSWGDLEMLRAVGHPFYVGATRPDGTNNLIHLPGASMLDIARRIAVATPSLR